MEKAHVSLTIKKSLRDLSEKNLKFILDSINDSFGLELDDFYIGEATRQIYNLSRRGNIDYNLRGAHFHLSAYKENEAKYTRLNVKTQSPVPNSREREERLRGVMTRAQQPAKRTRIIF